MTLSHYIEHQKITASAFADLIGVSRQAVHRYLNGRFPETDVLVKILAATNGAVTADDFLAPFITQDGVRLDANGNSLPRSIEGV